MSGKGRDYCDRLDEDGKLPIDELIAKRYDYANKKR